MDNVSRILTWLAFAGAVEYGRKHWTSPQLTIEDRGARDYHWRLIWAMQRDLGSPPVGLIRSV